MWRQSKAWECDKIIAHKIVVIKNPKVTYQVAQEKLWPVSHCTSPGHIRLLHISKVKKILFLKNQQTGGRWLTTPERKIYESIPLSYFGIASKHQNVFLIKFIRLTDHTLQGTLKVIRNFFKNTLFNHLSFNGIN